MVDYFDLAYAAGIIDGEGTIVIEKSHDRKSRGHIRYRMQVSVTNTNPVLIEWLHDKFNGSTYSFAYDNGKHKDMLIWRISSDKASDFLNAVMPFLKLKKLQAKLAIEFQSPIITKRRKPLTEEELAVREAQRLTMGELNHKGK